MTDKPPSLTAADCDAIADGLIDQLETYDFTGSVRADLTSALHHILRVKAALLEQRVH